MHRRVSRTITAQNQWTDWIAIQEKGLLTIYDTSSMTMTVTLQMRPPGETTPTRDVETFTTEDVKVIRHGGASEFRIGVKTGDYTSGEAAVSISSDR